MNNQEHVNGQEKNPINLADPAIKEKLEEIVFTKTKSTRADQWLGALALLLVANQYDPENDSIELNINGVRLCIELLPPEDDSPMRDSSEDGSGEGRF